MKFLENLSEFTGGARGGLGALGELLAQAALGEATARPGDRTGAGAARGFAAGTAGLGDSFARARGMRDRERVRGMAAEKLKDPNLGPAERDLYTAIASGNTAALELFDETLAARGSDRADRAEQAKLDYYNAKLAGLSGPKAPTAEQMTQHREIMALRKQFIERPEAFGEIDLQNPDNDLLRSRQISPVGYDPLGEAYLEWSGLDPLMKDRIPFQDFVAQRHGQEGMRLLEDEYGIGGSGGGAPETGGAVADAANSPQSGGAGGIVDTVTGAVSGALGGPEGSPSFFDTEYGALFNDLFGTDYKGTRQRQSEMDSILSEIDAAARGENIAPPRITGGGILVPDDQIDEAFNSITGGGPDLLAREDALRRTTGPESRLNSFMNKVFPSLGAPGFYREPGVEDPISRVLRETGRDVRASVSQIPAAFGQAGSELGSTIGRLPGDFMSALGTARGGNYSTTFDASGAGEKARADWPYPLPFQWMYEPEDNQGKRWETLLRDVGMGR